MSQQAEKDRVRVVDTNICSNVAVTHSMILAIPQVVSKVEALVLFPGIERTAAIRHGVRYWNQGFGKSLLVVGQHEEDFANENLPREIFVKKFDVTVRDTICSQVHAKICPMQVTWAVDQIEILGIKSIAFFAPPFHMVRVYLTFLKEIIRRNMRIAIIPMATPMSPDEIIPLTNHDQWNLFPAEVMKIDNYQVKGDVATLHELQTYLKWLWKHPILSDELVHPNQ